MICLPYYSITVNQNKSLSNKKRIIKLSFIVVKPSFKGSKTCNLKYKDFKCKEN